MKLKKLIEGLSWERTPGKPLPTLKDVMDKNNEATNKLNEAMKEYDRKAAARKGLGDSPATSGALGVDPEGTGALVDTGGETAATGIGIGYGDAGAEAAAEAARNAIASMEGSRLTTGA